MYKYEPAKGSRIRMLIVGARNWRIENSFQCSLVTERLCGSRAGSSKVPLEGTSQGHGNGTSSFGCRHVILDSGG
jgi:hypothetical protein